MMTEPALFDRSSINAPIRRAALVRRGMMQLMRRLRAERSEEPLSPSKLSVLGWLARNGGMTATAIAAAERVKPQSLTRLLAILDAEGLIRRRGGAEDRREMVIALTEAGAKALKRDMRQRDQWLARAMAQQLTPTEQELLVLAATLMERLAEAELTPSNDTLQEDEP